MATDTGTRFQPFRRAAAISGSLAIGLACLAATAAEGQADPSFDCSRAKAADEVAICADATLSRLDSLAAAAFRSYEPSYLTRQKVAGLLLRDRSSCGADRTCIAAAQWNALETFSGDAPDWVQDFVVPQVAARAAQLARDAGAPFSTTPPTQPAQCVKTRITGVTTRFGNPVTSGNSDQGIAIAYANGGSVYSYDRGKQYDGAAIGQPVVLCLISTPYDCPAGDARGRVYFTLDPATRNNWVSSDAEHGCGGA